MNKQQQKYTQIQQILIIRSISASQDYFPSVFPFVPSNHSFHGLNSLSPLLSEVWCPLYWHRQTASCLFVVSGICAYSSNLKYFIGQCYKPLSAAVVSGRARDFSLSVGTGESRWETGGRVVMWRSVPEINLLGVPEVYQDRETTSGWHFQACRWKFSISGK